MADRSTSLRVRIALTLILAGLVLVPPRATYAAPFCQPDDVPEFRSGFALLKEALGPAMGDPVECEHQEGTTGDTVQLTTTGLAYYSRATNIPMFTDGSRHWGWTADGLVSSEPYESLLTRTAMDYVAAVQMNDLPKLRSFYREGVSIKPGERRAHNHPLGPAYFYSPLDTQIIQQCLDQIPSESVTLQPHRLPVSGARFRDNISLNSTQDFTFTKKDGAKAMVDFFIRDDTMKSDLFIVYVFLANCP